MPSILVPSSYKILDKKYGGWIEVSKIANGNAECWTGEIFCQVSCTKTATEENKFLLLDAVTLLGAGNHTERIEVCYKWPTPSLMKQKNHEQSPTCFIRDHEILALKDFSKRKMNPKNNREYFIIPQTHCHQLNFLNQIPYKLQGKSIVIYNDDLPYVDNVCEKGMDPDGQLHLHRYMDMALSLKGNLRQRKQNKAEHIEIASSHLPLSSWRRLRRAISLSGLTNSYSFKVNEICGREKKKKRRVRLRFLDASCEGVKEKLPHTEIIQAVKYNGKERMSWIELEWKEEESKAIIIEGIQLWPSKVTHIDSASNKVDV